MGPKLSNVVDLYIHGVRDGHLSAALDKYVGDRFVEHSPGIGNGREGLAEAFEPLLERHYRRSVHPMRGFEDGSKVFLHTFSTFGWREVEHVTLDIFDTDADDHIVEHWGVTTPLVARTQSGCSQIDGPRWVTDTELTGANKDLVERYVRQSLIGGANPAAYVSSCIEHDPDPETPVRYRELLQLAGSGNFVATACRFLDPAGRSRTAADLYRVECGRIVEHWTARQA
jgi:predicted SnoaL-like aldol condensation-catalyzing enzyme